MLPKKTHTEEVLELLPYVYELERLLEQLKEDPEDNHPDPVFWMALGKVLENTRIRINEILDLSKIPGYVEAFGKRDAKNKLLGPGPCACGEKGIDGPPGPPEEDPSF